MNLEKENFEPFKKEIFLPIPSIFKSFKTILDAKPLFSPSTSSKIPLIPAIYFNYDPTDNIGSEIINTYNIINTNLKKLEIIKKYILVILECTKFSLEKIEISKEKYSLEKDKLIINFEDDLNKTFKNQNDFTEFIKKFVKNGNSLLKENNKNKTKEPNFYLIFQNEFKDNKSKGFFIKLLKKYLDIRNKLVEYILKNYGILAFDLFFDIGKAEDYKKIKYKESLKDLSTINYDQYVLYGNNLNTNNDIFKVGDYVTSKKSLTNKIITKIDFQSNPNTPYFIKDVLTSTIQKLSKNDFENDYNKKEIIKASGEVIKKITKRNLAGKIHNFDLLYTNILSEQYIKDEHNEKIHLYYTELKNSIEKYVGEDAKFNLYNVIISSLEVDFNIIKFIFFYVYPIIFHKAVSIHYKIKNEISFMINKFENNYDSYIDWYNMFIGAVSPNLLEFDKDSTSDFKTYFDKMIDDKIE